MSTNLNNTEALWQNFALTNSLSDIQLNQFKIYYDLLISTNKQYNLTAITNLEDVLNYHFSDSLVIANTTDFNKIDTICDVGTGGGFPGIPLKIKFPNLKVILIEVVGKKIIFLNEIIETLGLSDIEIIDVDWRTFLRKSDFDIDLFCSRASLSPDELIRALGPTSPYKNSTIVYWASETWHPNNKEAGLIEKDYWYNIGNKNRHLVFFKHPSI